MSDNKSLHHECGIFGIYNCPEASNITYLGLTAIQHRGQEGAGIASRENDHFNIHRAEGLVTDVFKKMNLKNLKGDSAIGHVRYSTTGHGTAKNLQPFIFEHALGELALVHNGNLVKSDSLKKQLVSDGAIFTSTSDTEIIMHLIARSKKANIKDRIIEAVSQIKGAFSLIFLTEDSLIALRDPWGYRPLVLGKRGENGREGYVVSSETSPFRLLEVEKIREIEPGEIVEINSKGIHSEKYIKSEQKKSSCVFELIYFARPDSTIFEKSVYDFRMKLGELLAKKLNFQADFVSPIPDSGTVSAIGFSRASNIPLHLALIRNHYVGRTFIEPKSEIRHFGVKLKLHPVEHLIKGKSIILIDDSIVRGTTSKKIIKEIKSCGAKEVHMMITSPPFKSPCFYGIDTPSKEELIANKLSVEEIRQFVGCDTLTYISLEELQSIAKPEDYCFACFDGKYSV